MDPFTQHMLEKAEQRSRALGISKASKFPLTECSVASSSVAQNLEPTKPMPNRSHSPAGQSISSSSSSSGGGKVVILDKAMLEASPTKLLRHYAAINKENMEMGIEINITSAKEIGVQVEIQEQEVTDDEETPGDAVDNPVQAINQPLARLRDTSRSQLKRMGDLYSNTADLSSPIHRTEAQFHTGDDDDDSSRRSPRQGKQRLGKLAALADTINQWEDDIAHHDVHRPIKAVAVPPPKPSRQGKKGPAPQPPKRDEGDEGGKTKQLKWDPKVLSSLEAQGFQRRDSSTIKHTFDYAKQGEAAATATDTAKPPVPGKSTAVSKVARTFGPTASAAVSTKIASVSGTSVKPGLVSGRAAIFENKAGAGGQMQGGHRSQKDPCEFSLKERMKLFETGNNKAILPKAPIATAASITQIRQEESKAHVAAVHPVTAAAVSSTVSDVAAQKPKPENKLRDKVATLVANAQSSAESRIKDIDRQRQEDMQVIANRFNKQKELFVPQSAAKATPAPASASVPVTVSKPVRPMPPPPPPPMSGLSPAIATSKRSSPGDAPIIDEESKRARKSNSERLYPALSDLDSSGENCCATVTATATDDSDRQEQDETESCIDESEDQSQTKDCSTGMCSLGREIMKAVQRNEAEIQQQGKKTVRYADQDLYYNHEGQDSSDNSSQVSAGIDDYLDEALVEDFGSTQDDDSDGADEHNSSHLSLGSKGTTASNSFSFQKNPTSTSFLPVDEHQEIMDVQTPLLSGAQPVRSDLSLKQDNDNLVTLVHTVSFYRRQQSANISTSTPVRKIFREQQVMRSALAGDCHAKHKLEYDSPQHGGMAEAGAGASMDDHTDDDDEELQNARDSNDATQAQDKIKKLLSEVCKQQQVIGQTSQALNLCAATVEFSGSTESVEGERYLLLATHRRQSCLDEVQRLRVENSVLPVGGPKEKGLLTVKDIIIPLRHEYLRKMASGSINGHHLVCLLKYNEHVLATKTVSTMPGLVSVQFPDVLQLNNVYADFRITLGIYGMLAQREQLPHDLKYHINLNKKGGVKTPKKKGGENRLVMPPVQSPAGPHVVRTPQLVQYGFAIFSLREIQRTSWTLTQVLGVSPLEGVVHMKVNCELSVSVEYKGFLTIFEDISGFGAWHRRWCYLNGSVLNFWKYPDDEKKKTPIGSIDLNACSSQKVTTAPRDICARLNTMLLECERPAKDTDQESLIIVPNGRTTTIRHLLSADTKEEREEWSAYFNKALTLLRAWGPTQ
ncbi:anillin-like isoform X2 [Drosophila miranda]|uniref:anillin-like isoform X2 n=1 Tax=Drosophila miranda TaxID=7229 RepID=UPI00143F962B|nr:anillin-like isoform X2 [Drosophila miranda]